MNQDNKNFVYIKLLDCEIKFLCMLSKYNDYDYSDEAVIDGLSVLHKILNED